MESIFNGLYQSHFCNTTKPGYTLLLQHKYEHVYITSPDFQRCELIKRLRCMYNFSVFKFYHFTYEGPSLAILLEKHCPLLVAQKWRRCLNKALSLTGGPEVEKMFEFVHMFDKFFNCLNVTKFAAGKYSPGPQTTRKMTSGSR